MDPIPKVIFLGKEKDDYCSKAINFCQDNFDVVHYYLEKMGDRSPKNVGWCDCDYIISYLSTCIVPAIVLKNAKVAAINFHPGPPNYPGIGCTNFALYENASDYGVTCHHMAEKVDTGQIISFKTVPISPTDTVATLTSKAYDSQLVLFFEVMALILNGEPLPKSEKQWQGKSTTRKELDELGRLTPNMSKEEITRRIRATSYKQWQPSMKIHGFEFGLRSGGKTNMNPIAPSG